MLTHPVVFRAELRWASTGKMFSVLPVYSPFLDGRKTAIDCDVVSYNTQLKCVKLMNVVHVVYYIED